MKQSLIWILALAAMAFSTTTHAQRSLPDSFMFEGINLNNTSYNEIIATFGTPDEYHMSPGDFPEDGNIEHFLYNFPGPDVFLGRGELHIVISGGTITDFSVMGSDYKIFTDINGGVGPGDPIGWFAQNNFTLSAPETTAVPGVSFRRIVFQPDIDYITFRVQEANGVIVNIYITTL